VCAGIAALVVAADAGAPQNIPRAPSSGTTQPSPPQPSITKFDDKDAARASASSAAADPGCAAYGDAATKAACEAYAKAAFEHQIWTLQYRQRAYEAHHANSFWVFLLVCALVVLGMYLSLREFNLDSRRREALIAQLSKRLRRVAAGKADDAKAEAEDAGAGPVTTLGIDPTGVKLTSPVLGVIILVVSMGFFYLYLKTVYPINETVEPPAAAAQAPPSK
jgi:hypothetical protein